MATQLKHMYNHTFFENLCVTLSKTIEGFDATDFILRIFNNDWPDLELKARVRHITHALHHFLSSDFTIAATQLVAVVNALRSAEARTQGFEYMFIPDYIEVYGIDFPNESLYALKDITKLVSAEFAVRQFLLRHPKKTIEHLIEWSKDSDPNVRRLASEGSRPRLPWAVALPMFKLDPTPMMPVLERLSADPSDYVRRSVANHLNDIAKDNPEVVLDISRKWSGKNNMTDRIIKHGCRTLLKSGNVQALALHGFSANARSKIKKLIVPRTVKIGGDLFFSFSFVNEEEKPGSFRLEYAIDYITSSGKISRKIFKIMEKTFPPQSPVAVRQKQSFRNLTIRKHSPGEHTIGIHVNGKRVASSRFMVL